jgi:hypothetical protein
MMPRLLAPKSRLSLQMSFYVSSAVSAAILVLRDGYGKRS